MPIESAAYLRWLRTALALFRACVLVLLTLGAVLATVFWIRGFYTDDWITWIRESKDGNGLIVYAMVQHHGQLSPYWLTDPDRSWPMPQGFSWSNGGYVTNVLNSAWVSMSYEHRRFNWRAMGDPDKRAVALIMPSWFPPLLFWAPSPIVVWWLWRQLRRRRRMARGQCPTCGYDLRASTGRCPECGEAIPDASAGSDQRNTHAAKS